MGEVLNRKFSLFDDSYEVDNVQVYSKLLRYIFGIPNISRLSRIIELLGLGTTSASTKDGIYQYFPIIWRILIGIFLIYGWIHFCLLRPGINLVVQIPIYSIPLCGYFFGPYTLLWMEPTVVSMDIIRCSKEVLLEFGWLFYAVPFFCTIYQFIGFFIFQHISGSFLFYGTQHAQYFQNEVFFIIYYCLFWLFSGILLGFIVAHCMIWMRIHEKQLKLFRNYLISNTSLPNGSNKNIFDSYNERETSFSSTSHRRSEIGTILSPLPPPPPPPPSLPPDITSPFGITTDSNDERITTSIPFSSDLHYNSQLTILALQPNLLMSTHEIFRKSVIQSSQYCSLFTISIFLFTTADYFLLLLVLRTQSSILTVWTFIRTILWMILNFLIMTSAARITQSWHQISVTIAAIRVLHTSLNDPSFSSDPKRSEIISRQWDELVSYFDHVRYSNGYNYQIGAISITSSLIAKCCVAVIYATYLIIYGFG